jgi:hypothetical protein
MEIIEAPIPQELPSLFKKALDRITLYETVMNVDLSKDYKILCHTLLLLDNGNVVQIYYLGFNKSGFEPYFDVQMELAYDYFAKNMNCVIVNKGDDSIEIKVDGKTIGKTEGIESSMVHYHDEEAYIARKWVSFNFREL